MPVFYSNIKKLIKGLAIKALCFSKRGNTSLGKIIWFFNGILVIFYINYILYILLSPYGFLNQFTIALGAIIYFVIAVVIFTLDFKPFLFLNKIPLLYHIIFLLVLSFVYIISLKHIWTQKEKYTI